MNAALFFLFGSLFKFHEKLDLIQQVRRREWNKVDTNIVFRKLFMCDQVAGITVKKKKKKKKAIHEAIFHHNQLLKGAQW